MLIKNHVTQKCLYTYYTGSRYEARTTTCDDTDLTQKWAWFGNLLQSMSNTYCIGVATSNPTATLLFYNCNSADSKQYWQNNNAIIASQYYPGYSLTASLVSTNVYLDPSSTNWQRWCENGNCLTSSFTTTPTLTITSSTSAIKNKISTVTASKTPSITESNTDNLPLVQIAQHTQSSFGAGSTSFPIGAIIGCAVGGVVVVTGTIALIYYKLCRKSVSTASCSQISNTDAQHIIHVNAPIGIGLSTDKIDLISLANSTVSFNYSDNATKIRTSWVGPKDAFLIYDHNNNKQVDMARELVLTKWSNTATTDFEALKEVFDTNEDNKFDAQDKEFHMFYIWQDINQDGISQSNELTSLVNIGLQKIDFNTEQTIRDEFFGKQQEMRVAGIFWTSGNQTLAYDLALEV